MLGFAWSAFKFLLSALLVALAALLAYFSFAAQQFAAIGIAALFIFLAALPWMNWTAPTRALALAGVVFGLGFAFASYRRLVGATPFPRECSSRGWLLCQFENALFQLGGLPLVAAVWLTLAAALLALSIYGVFKQSSQRPIGSR